MSETLTPMMQQYRDVKNRMPDKLIFFRCGDFYEVFFEDAVVASRELEITLTSRNKDKKGEAIPMAGVPYHAVDGYVARLVRRGYKVAICEQLEDPRPGTLVKREVTRVFSPGTVTEDSMLDPRDNNYLAALLPRGDGFGLAFLDVSTGDFFATEDRSPRHEETLLAELHRFAPSELVFPAASAPVLEMRSLAPALEGVARSPLEEYDFELETASGMLRDCFGVSTLDGFGLRDRPLATAAAGALLRYVREGNLLALDHLDGVRFFESREFMRLDPESVTNLELVRAQDGERAHALLAVLDHTATSMGARTLKAWLLRPLLDPARIRERLDGVEALVRDYLLRERLRETLSPIQDLERLLSRVTTGTARGRDLLGLKSSLAPLPDLRTLLGSIPSGPFPAWAEDFDALEDVWDLLERTIHESPPASLNEGGLIKDGYDPELDELRSLSRDGKSYIAALEARERERTGIPSLKVSYNRVFGYYIEVTRANQHLVPEDFIRKQTLANAERFITPELKEYEEKVLTAEERMVALEKSIFDSVRRQVASAARRITSTARMVAEADVLGSLAEVAVRNRYCRPEVVDSPFLDITQGRHPVIERQEESFIPNDTFLDGEAHQLIILTGPNMGGKSTYLRQVALIAILAQVGSFVPAEAATVGVVDQVFTRVGASDNLARGRSTFMVEMIETANILRTCTPRSLVLLDEVGRGTATFDGLSIAWSVAEYLATAQDHRAKTLFATHYHELTRLESLYEGVRNHCVTVKESGGEILFLRRVVPGTANRSYGIEVARLAGMPKAVLQRAGEVLRRLERKDIDVVGRPRTKDAALDELQPRLF